MESDVRYILRTLNWQERDKNCEISNELTVCVFYAFRLMVKQCEKNLNATWTFVFREINKLLLVNSFYKFF